MPRKRMIDPSLWASESFSKLSDMGRLMFIGMFSNADDEGRGRANPALLKSTIFPLDELRRVTDIKKTLEEIGSQMSITLYTLDGVDYYSFDKWKKWQKVDKPKHSHIPPPQKSPCNGGGGNSSQSTTEPPPIADMSATDTRHISPNTEDRIQNTEYGIQNEEKVREFFRTDMNNIVIDTEPKLSLEDYKKIAKCYKKSEWLRKNIKHLSKIDKLSKKIITGFYNGKSNGSDPADFVDRKLTTEQMAQMLESMEDL